MLILWFVAANMYYGVVLISTELLNSSSDTCGGAVSGLSSPNVTTGGAYDEEVECSLHKCRYSALHPDIRSSDKSAPQIDPTYGILLKGPLNCDIRIG